MEAATPSSASYAWKSIIREREVIRRGAIWRIGDGKLVDIWGDRWLPLKHSPKILSPRRNLGGAAKVYSLIDQNKRCWNADVLSQPFMAFEAATVRTIPLCHTDQLDALIWPHNPNGEYSVKSGYKFLQLEEAHSRPRQLDYENLKPLWQEIWNLLVPSKVKHLVWRAAKNSLPTKMNLMRRKITTDDCCEICQGQQEDVLHAHW